MHINKITICISKKKISLNSLNFLYTRDVGSVIFFIGIVREFNKGKRVSSISYSIFPKLMYSLLKKKCDFLLLATKIIKICILQYNGVLFPGDINLVVGVSTSHREKSFLYCSEIVEFIKKYAPIWKKEYYCDGSSEWINV